MLPGGPGGPPAPFTGLPGYPPAFFGGAPGRPSLPHPGPNGFLGSGAAFNPAMWANSGVPNPQHTGKPPGQGGFTVQSLLPPTLRAHLPPFTGA